MCVNILTTKKVHLPSIYSFVSFVPSLDLCFLLGSFLFSLNNFCYHIFYIVMVETNSAFVCLKMVSISPPFLNYHFTAYRMFSWLLVFFQPLRDVLHCTWPLLFFVIGILVPLYVQQFDCKMSRYVFIWIDFLWGSLTFFIYKSMSFVNLERSQSLFL